MTDTTLHNRTDPWPHPDKATRYDGDLAQDRRPWAEGWHAADNGHHVATCPYDHIEEDKDAERWFDGWMARWKRIHPLSEDSACTKSA